MKCQNCHELLDPGAAFCGNCGYPVSPATTTEQAPQSMPQQSGSQLANIPTYAKSTPSQHIGESTAVLSIISGVVGIIGAIVVPAIGLGFGIAGMVFGTVSRRRARRQLALAGLFVAFLAIAAGMGSLVHNLNQSKNSKPSVQTGQSSTSSTVTAMLKTPCYSFNLIDKFNVSNQKGSCDATAYNGTSFNDSTNIYKIVATVAGTTNPAAFTQLVKQGIEKDVQDNLPGYAITSQSPTSFAGSVAYAANVQNSAQDAAGVEEAVLHQGKTSDDAFIIVHLAVGSSANLQALEGQWQWQ